MIFVFVLIVHTLCITNAKTVDENLFTHITPIKLKLSGIEFIKHEIAKTLKTNFSNDMKKIQKTKHFKIKNCNDGSIICLKFKKAHKFNSDVVFSFVDLDCSKIDISWLKFNILFNNSKLNVKYSFNPVCFYLNGFPSLKLQLKNKALTKIFDEYKVLRLSLTTAHDFPVMTVKRVSEVNSTILIFLKKQRRFKEKYIDKVGRIWNVSHVKRKSPCDHTKECCKVSYTISVEELGWSHIIVAPSSFTIKICVGPCDQKINDLNLNVLFMKQLKEMYKKSLSKKELANYNKLDTGLCCSPTKFKKFGIIYFNLDNVLETSYVNLSAEECACI